MSVSSNFRIRKQYVPKLGQLAATTSATSGQRLNACVCSLLFQLEKCAILLSQTPGIPDSAYSPKIVYNNPSWDWQERTYKKDFNTLGAWHFCLQARDWHSHRVTESLQPRFENMSSIIFVRSTNDSTLHYVAMSLKGCSQDILARKTIIHIKHGW